MFLSLLELKAFKVLFLVIIIQGTLKRWIMYLLYCNYLVIIILYDITKTENVRVSIGKTLLHIRYSSRITRLGQRIDIV